MEQNLHTFVAKCELVELWKTPVYVLCCKSFSSVLSVARCDKALRQQKTTIKVLSKLEVFLYQSNRVSAKLDVLLVLLYVDTIL